MMMLQLPLRLLIQGHRLRVPRLRLLHQVVLLPLPPRRLVVRRLDLVRRPADVGEEDGEVLLRLLLDAVRLELAPRVHGARLL